MMIDPNLAEMFRYLYAVLSAIAGCGFVTTLVIRWDVLHRGERIVRVGLVVEHVVITYGGYTALKLNYPPTIVGAAMTASLVVVIVGFAVWLADIAMRGDGGPTRLTDS